MCNVQLRVFADNKRMCQAEQAHSRAKADRRLREMLRILERLVHHGEQERRGVVRHEGERVDKLGEEPTRIESRAARLQEESAHATAS